MATAIQQRALGVCPPVTNNPRQKFEFESGRAHDSLSILDHHPAGYNGRCGMDVSRSRIDFLNGGSGDRTSEDAV